MEIFSGYLGALVVYDGKSQTSIIIYCRTKEETKLRFVLRSKIHRAWVTDANPDYVGSILIDEDLMDKIDPLEFRKGVGLRRDQR